MTTIPSPDQRVDVGGRGLWVVRAGAGGPPVVCVPGAGSFGWDFALVHQRVAEMTTSVLYDRAGTGWSEDAELPRTAEEVTTELRALLAGIGVAPPYVLVGHSLGGLYVQHYAQRFPDEVAGQVLLDPLHEDWDLYLPEALRLVDNQTNEVPELPAEFVAAYREVFTPLFAAFPDELRALVIDRHLSPGRLLTGFREGTNVLELLSELREGGPRPEVPTVILSGGAIDATQTMFVPEALLREQLAGSQRLYAVLAAAWPQAEHRVLDDASHAGIPMVRPDAVADAVREVLGRVG